MSDHALQFIVVLALVYASDMISYLAPPRRALVQGLWRHRLTKSGLNLLSPFPWSLAFTAEGFRVAFGAQAMYAYQPHTITTSKPVGWGHRVARYDELQQVRARDNELVVNGRLFLSLTSRHAARVTAAWIERVRAARGQARRRVIREITREMLDVPAVQGRVKQVARRTLPLRVAGTLLLADIALTVALFVVTDWAFPQWPRFLAGFLVLLAATLVELFFALKELLPEERDTRWGRTLFALLSFLSATRAASAVSRDLLAAYHWLAGARVLCGRAAFIEAARFELLAWEHLVPLPGIDAHPGAAAALEEFRPIAREAVGRLLEDAGADLGALLAPPNPSHDASWGFCPRCLAEYDREVACCEDCGAAPRPFAPSAPA